MQRIRETLRVALNAAIREELLTFNAAKWVEMPPAQRSKPMLWTEERVEYWRRTGQVPGAVMVWTPEQTGQFLDHAVHDRLYPLYHLVAHRGVRRGEACGQRWIDTHLDAASLDVLNQIVQYGWETGMDTPKTDESATTLALDEDTVTVLRARPAGRRAAAGGDTVGGDRVGVHPGRWQPAAPRRRHRALPAPRPAGRVAADPAA